MQNSTKYNFYTFKQKRIQAQLITPAFKSVNVLKEEYKEERGFEKEVNKWMEEENYLPKLQLKHEQELKKKNSEITSLHRQLWVEK